MAGKDNLRKLTTEEAREIGKKGGKASVKARQERKTLAEELRLLLSQGNTQEKLSIALLEEALQGNTKAYEIIRDTIGEKPTDKVEVGQTEPFKIEIEVL